MSETFEEYFEVKVTGTCSKKGSLTGSDIFTQRYQYYEDPYNTTLNYRKALDSYFAVLDKKGLNAASNITMRGNLVRNRIDK